jgi:hypothetical protein
LITSVVDGHLVLLNLAGTAAAAMVSLPQTGGSVALYRGEQVVTPRGSDLTAALAPAEGRIEPAWFTLRGAFGRAVPSGLRATVSHAAELKLTAPSGGPVSLTVEFLGEAARQVTVPGGRTVTVAARETRPYPLDDLAVGAVTFPAEPLPQGMSSPGAAVDDNPATAWHPGLNGRMVVDLGAVVPVSAAELSWAPGRIPTAVVEYSTDGRTYTAAPLPGRGRTVSVPLKVSARYVAVRVTGSRPGDAGLTRLSVHA